MNNYIFPEELDNFSVDGAEAIITATADGNRVQFTQEGDENGEVWISGLGDLFTSKKNGHKLFIPFAGGWFGNFTSAGYNAYIWSSFVHTDVNSHAYSLDCDSSAGAYVNYFYSRSDALSVRGVFKK